MKRNNIACTWVCTGPSPTHIRLCYICLHICVASTTATPMLTLPTNNRMIRCRVPHITHWYHLTRRPAAPRSHGYHVDIPISVIMSSALSGLVNTTSAPQLIKKPLSSGTVLPVTPMMKQEQPCSLSCLVALGPLSTGIS